MSAPPDRQGSEDDPVFQAGVENIIRTYEAQLGRVLQADELSTIVDQAKEFFNGQACQGSVNSGATHLVPRASGDPQASSADLEAPYPSSFAKIAELIASGAPLNEMSVPGIKTIPDKINDEVPSEAKLAVRDGAGKKPWER